MDFIIAIFAACLVAIPYRHLKMRYRLISHDNSENCFYGTDEMVEAYDNEINKKTKNKLGGHLK